MKFATLASCFERLEATSSRNDMIAILARLLAGTSPDEIGIVCYFVLGEIGPGYSGVTPGIGDRTAAAAIALAAGVDLASVETAARKLGDYGDVAASLAWSAPEGPAEPLTVTDVHRGFMEIAQASGPGSADRKMRILAAMLAAATPTERRYLVRLATGKMRLGVGDMTLLDALAEAFLGSKAERPPLEHAYNISSDIGLVARTLLEEGLSGSWRYRSPCTAPSGRCLPSGSLGYQRSLSGSALRSSLSRRNAMANGSRPTKTVTMSPCFRGG